MLRYASLLAFLNAALAVPASGGSLLTTLASFNGTNGAVPSGLLVQAIDESFYGTTTHGGIGFDGRPTTGGGTIFKLTANGGLTNIHTLTATEGGLTRYGLISASDGNFYGSTPTAGRYGSIFRMDRTGQFTTIYTFTGGSDGQSPNGLIQASDGFLYGTTYGRPNTTYGTVFRISTNGNLTTLHSFGGASGYNPVAGLLEAADGNFYGATRGFALQNDFGGVFRITKGGAFTALFISRGYSPIAVPASVLTKGGDGMLYGTSLEGGDLSQNFGYGDGCVFRIETNGPLTVVASFTGPNTAYDPVSSPPSATLLKAEGGFYGTTYSGGTSNSGTIFHVTQNGGLKTLYSFAGAMDGRYPIAGLIQGKDGLYGTTSSGGQNNCGTVFRFRPPPILQNLSRKNTTSILSWAAVSGETYQLQYCSNLTQNVWIDLGNPLTATNSTVTVEDNSEDSERFYRAVLF